MKSARFLSKDYRIELREHPSEWGRCEAPQTPGRTIYLHPKLKGRKKAEIYTHEALHACLFALPEKVVRRMARDIVRFLDRAGCLKD